ncbi:MAG: MotA/TolQ/ExbB proton channel family protein [Elusimicrobia bacterium]|nr:MotA/TolQ/ExbB proton channel family protein [Elusimicrobiota bacterium]
MDFTSLVGILGVIGLIYLGQKTGELTSVFLNWHGMIVVLGGTAVAMFLNTPGRYLWKGFYSLLSIFRNSPYGSPERTISLMVSLAESAQARGMNVLKEVDSRVAEGFLVRASQLALEQNNSDFVREVLEREINQESEVDNENANLFRVMGTLAPMFGLVGTLIGIVQVLRQLSNPEQVGPAMAVAITSAFYGILFSNLVCIPAAGKLRIRSLQKVQTKAMILEGVLLVMKGEIPLLVETKLRSYL